MTRIFPVLVVLLAFVYIASTAVMPSDQTEWRFQEVARVPVLVGGRIKPFDSVARHALLAMRGKQSISDPSGKPLIPSQWLLDMAAKPETANDYAVFRIDHPDVLGLFGWQQKSEKYFSFNQLKPHLDEIKRQSDLLKDVPSQQQNPFQRAILKLFNDLLLYQKLQNSLRPDDSQSFARELGFYLQSLGPGLKAAQAQEAHQPFNERDLNALVQFVGRYQGIKEISIIHTAWPLMPGTPRDSWGNLGQSLLDTIKTLKIHPAVQGWAAILDAYTSGSASLFNEKVAALLQAQANASYQPEIERAKLEVRFNQFEPFYQCMLLYVVVFMLAAGSWLGWSEPLRRAAFWLLIFTFVIHTLGLGTRMYLQGRPPVTNLYSSAIFVGWAVVLLSIFLEKIYRDGIGCVAASALGFTTLLIAHHLALEGDTMEMLRAVLDTNFWLATHVVCVTLGYSTTYLAGFLGLLFVIRGVFTPSLDTKTAKALGRMTYGVVCFATLFSFVGTILGGIWADQSWGRFWGWDPKENGALMIVLWNAIVLHARWGGFARERGTALLVIFGNVITSFSWFGVNMLGIGLHSYGFMDEAYFWLITFCVSQVAMICVGLLPYELWRSPWPKRVQPQPA